MRIESLYGTYAKAKSYPSNLPQKALVSRRKRKFELQALLGQAIHDAYPIGPTAKEGPWVYTAIQTFRTKPRWSGCREASLIFKSMLQLGANDMPDVYEKLSICTGDTWTDSQWETYHSNVDCFSPMINKIVEDRPLRYVIKRAKAATTE